VDNPQQLQAVLQVIFDRLKALEDAIAELRKMQDDLLSR
jgi:prefoldin subunit 5